MLIQAGIKKLLVGGKRVIVLVYVGCIRRMQANIKKLLVGGKQGIYKIVVGLAFKQPTTQIIHVLSLLRSTILHFFMVSLHGVLSTSRFILNLIA